MRIGPTQLAAEVAADGVRRTIHSTVSTHFKKTYEENLLQMEAGIGPMVRNVPPLPIAHACTHIRARALSLPTHPPKLCLQHNGVASQRPSPIISDHSQMFSIVICKLAQNRRSDMHEKTTVAQKNNK